MPVITKKFVLPNAALAFTVVAWAYNFSAVRLVYGAMSPASLALTRLILVYILFAGYCLATGISLKYPKGTAFKFLLQGFMANGIYMVLFLEGMKRTTPALGSTIMAMAPVFAALLAMGLRAEPFRWQRLAGACVAFAGVAIAERDPSGLHGTLAGNLMILSAALLWSIALLVMKPLVAEVGPVRALTLALPGAFLALVPVGASDAIHQSWNFGLPVWLNFAHVALISGGVGFATYYKGVHQIGVVRATMYQFVVPPLAALVAWGVFGQQPGPQFWFGVLFVIGGAVLASQAPHH